MKTYSVKPTDINREWFVVDASEAPVGRVATRIATMLTGKAKPQFSKHIDCGDYVVVINADSLVVTGDKLSKKTYYRHSHFPGGLTEVKLSDKLSQDSCSVIVSAVRGMLPVNKLRDGRLARLKVYRGSEHEHSAQKPKLISLKGNK